MIRSRFAIVVVSALVCACGSKDASTGGGSSIAGSSSFSLGSKSPGNQLVDAYNAMLQGTLDPMINIVQLPDTTTATREKVRNGFAQIARDAQSDPMHVELVSENVTGDLATVVMKMTGQQDGRPVSGNVTNHMIRSGDRWYWQPNQ